MFRGYPKEILSGSEFTSKAVNAWAYDKQVDYLFIGLGKPIQNAYIESFNVRLRDECINQNLFKSQEKARDIIETENRM